MNDQQRDVLDTALDPEPEFVYGQIHFEGYEGFVQKGTRGVIRYDKDAHGPDQWYTPVVDLVFTPIDPSRKIFKEELFLRWKRRNQIWLKIVLPAIQALCPELEKIKGLAADQYPILRTLNGMYFAAEYVDRPDNKEGETWSTLRPLQVFADEVACIAAYEADTGKRLGGSPAAGLPFMPDETPTATATYTPTDPVKASMAAFLPALWAQSGRDMIKMAGLLKDNPMIGQHFTVESPEVVEVMKA